MAPIAVAPTPSPAAVAAGSATNVDYARITAVEQNARYLGVQVIWVKQTQLR